MAEDLKVYLEQVEEAVSNGSWSELTPEMDKPVQWEAPTQAEWDRRRKIAQRNPLFRNILVP